MKPSCSLLLASLALGLVSAGEPPARTEAPAKTDLTQPHSPSLPAPKWLKIIDQGTKDPRLEGYLTPEGVKVEIVADAPAVVNPVGMTFADDGTPYVLEWRPSPGDEWREKAETFTCKDGSTRKVATMTKRVKDVVKTLHAGKADGTWDQAQVILEDELPSSILLHDGWIYLTGRGTVRRFRQSKPGGPYDVKEIVAQGFCGFHRHQVSGLTIGNDGWLYVTSGDDDNYVEGSDGSRATVLRTGAIFRCRPDGSRMQTFAMGFRNPYRDVAFDAEGNLFHADNDNEDGSKFTGCRLMHVAEGNDFGWRLRQGARCCSPDPVRGAVFGELPGKVPPLLETGRGAPAGLLIYNDTRFPENFRGLLYYPDVFRKLIRAYRVEPRGATFAVVEEFEFLKSDDPLFRPCQMVLGPDGAMYVVDWRTNSGGAGQLWGDGRHGRIYRLTWAGTREQPALAPRGMDSWQKIVKMGTPDLLETLASEDAGDRTRAQRELVRRGAEVRKPLLDFLGKTDQPEAARIAALGALESFWNADVQAAFQEVLENGEPALRRLAAEGLGLNAATGDPLAHAALLKGLSDENLAVRRAVVLAMGRVQAAGAADALVNSLAFDDSRDAYLHDGHVRAIESLGKPGIDRLVALAETGVARDTDKAVEAFTAMRTRPAFEALPALLANPHLKAAQRAALVRSCSNYLLDPPVALDPILDFLASHPEEAAPPVQLAALEVLSGSAALKTPRGAGWLLGLLDVDDAAVRLAAIKAVGETRPARGAPPLAKLLGEAERSAEEREAAAKALRGLNDRAAVPALRKALETPASAPGSAGLRREAYRTLAALDAEAALEMARAYVEKKDEAMIAEAVQVLGTTAEGTRLAARMYLDKKLPREMLPQVSEALRKHAGRNADLARLLTEVMKTGLLLANTPEEAARVAALVRKQGNPQRGRSLFLDSKRLACVNCHRLEGSGGAVGPDLTRLWETHSLEKILEAVIEPSKEIKEGYQTYQATTKKGRVYAGLKVAQTAGEVVLREANGRDVHLALKDVEKLAALEISLMPDNVVAQLSYPEFIDLVAFLSDRKAQESLRGLALDFWVVGPFGPDLKEACPPESRTDPKATYPGEKPGQVLEWQAVRAEPNGLLNLRTVFNRDRVSAYAFVYVFSPKVQKADLFVGCDDRMRVWICGTLVHEFAGSRSAAPDTDRVAVSLKEGWNPVLVKVGSETGPHGLFLRFAGEGVRVARTPDEGK